MRRRFPVFAIFAAFLAAVHAQPVSAGVQIDGDLSKSPSFLVEAVQKALLSKGAYNGKIDGAWGPETAKAFTTFSQKNGLPTSPRLTGGHIEELWGIRFDPNTHDYDEQMRFLQMIGIN